MKQYKVIVDGVEYEVGVELLSQAPQNKAAAPVAAAPVKAAPPSSGEQIKSPMPGTILSVSVQPGSAVKKGQVLMVLEALIQIK